MTNHTARLYAVAVAVLVLFVTWAAVAAHPWSAAAKRRPDPRVRALTAREQRLRRDAVVVRRVVAKRWHVYHVRLAARRREIAQARAQHLREVAAARAAAAAAPPVVSTASPAVRVVTLPPLTITRTS